MTYTTDSHGQKHYVFASPGPLTGVYTQAIDLGLHTRITHQHKIIPLVGHYAANGNTNDMHKTLVGGVVIDDPQENVLLMKRAHTAHIGWNSTSWWRR